jgi:hypothetical protein
MSLSYISNFDPSQGELFVLPSICSPQGPFVRPGSRSFDPPQTFSLIVSLGNLLSGEVGLNLIQLLCKRFEGGLTAASSCSWDGPIEMSGDWSARVDHTGDVF